MSSSSIPSSTYTSVNAQQQFTTTAATANPGYAGQYSIGSLINPATINYALSQYPNNNQGYYTFVGNSPFENGYNPPYQPYRAWQGGHKEIKRDEEFRHLFQVPVLFDTEMQQRHLTVWRECNAPWDDDAYLSANIDTYNNLVGRLNFFKEDDANFFMVWWNRYLNFFERTDHTTSLYPIVTKGRIDGYFVKTLTPEYIVNNSSLINTNLTNQWHWIVKNTQHGAIQVNEGWIFKSEADASLFTLMNRI